MDKALLTWGQKYGDIQTIWLGSSQVITVHDVPTVIETSQKDGETYADRPISQGMEIVRKCIL